MWPAPTLSHTLPSVLKSQLWELGVELRIHFKSHIWLSFLSWNFCPTHTFGGCSHWVTQAGFCLGRVLEVPESRFWWQLDDARQEPSGPEESWWSPQSVHILVSALRTGSVTNSLCKHVPGRQAMWNPLSLRSGAGLPAPSLSLFWPESSSLRSWGSLLHVLWGWIFLALLAAVTSADSLPWSLSKIFVDTSFFMYDFF